MTMTANNPGALPLSVITEQNGWPIADVADGFHWLIREGMLCGELMEVEVRTTGVWSDAGLSYVLADGETAAVIEWSWNLYVEVTS